MTTERDSISDQTARCEEILARIEQSSIAALAARYSIPRDFWRDVPCGHPQDPVAMLLPDDHWVCHCGWSLDPKDAISDGKKEGAPGPIVACRKCGCYPALGRRASRPYPHGSTACPGCHACAPERFPNVSAGYCGCHVCQPTIFVHAVTCPAERNRVGCDCRDTRAT